MCVGNRRENVKCGSVVEARHRREMLRYVIALHLYRASLLPATETPSRNMIRHVIRNIVIV